jgi:hypothetical protein
MAEFYIPIAIQRAVIVLSKGYCELDERLLTCFKLIELAL